MTANMAVMNAKQAAFVAALALAVSVATVLLMRPRTKSDRIPVVEAPSD